MAPLCQCVRQDAGVRIFHIATLADWKQAEADGTYTTSTYGVTLAEAGFLHAARHEQVREVLDTHYGEVTEPLVVLEIETDLLDVPWREDDVDGVMFPHIYGPLKTEAVVRWRPARLPPFEAAAKPPRPPLPDDRERLLRRDRGPRRDGRDPGDPGPGGPRPGPRRPTGAALLRSSSWCGPSPPRAGSPPPPALGVAWLLNQQAAARQSDPPAPS